MNEYVKFIKGTKERFDSLENRDENAIYFISDEQNHTNRIYIGDKCFNVDVIQDLSTEANNYTVPSSIAVRNALANKLSICKVKTFTDTSLPQVLELESDTEYRYTNLTGATSLNIKINDDIQNNYSYFYSSVILSKVNSTNSVADFISIDSSSAVTNIIFLNYDVTLNNTAELLFFSNGLHICCIVATYNSED